MPAAASGPRLLLRRMREIMAERITPQARLDKMVKLVAANMVAEVCSIYLLRPGGELELFATEGLNPGAVHRTRLRKGEGLVGDVAQSARPLNLPDAPAHPQFSYRPETGEDPYHSFLGVPVLRAGRALGVLVVQNKARRHYEEEEVEALLTVAMVLAEMVAAGGLIEDSVLEETGLKRDRPHRIRGTPASDGVAIGHVVLHEPRVIVERLIAEDLARERERLDRAIGELRGYIDRMLASGEAFEQETQSVLEAYRMFAHDAGWIERIREAIDTGLTAEAAVEKIHNETRARLLRQSDSYLHERLHDLDDLANRLLRHLAGVADTASRLNVPLDAVLVARTMGPAELLDYERARVRAVVLEEGSPTSHVAIVARAFNVPLVGRAEDILDRADNGDAIIVDGETGDVHLRPSPEIRSAYAAKIALCAQREAAYAALRDLPAVTRDNLRIALQMNAGLRSDIPHLDETGAEGIGLFRTELQFMINPSMPRIAVQASLYRAVLEASGARPVIFRTLDLGGDKALPYGQTVVEDNPAIGWRAIRITLDRPALLRYQTRALLAAAEGRALDLMFPMIAEAAEFLRAKEIVLREVERARALGKTMPTAIRYGAMLEVPALLWQLPQLLEHADFVSVGTNDLAQFFFASDRGNPRLGERYDVLSPPFLRALASVVEACRARSKPLAVCGEMAGRPLEAMALIALGYRTLSMPPASLGPVKAMVRSLELGALEPLLARLMSGTAHSLRDELKDFARRESVQIS